MNKILRLWAAPLRITSALRRMDAPSVSFQRPQHPTDSAIGPMGDVVGLHRISTHGRGMGKDRDLLRSLDQTRRRSPLTARFG